MLDLDAVVFDYGNTLTTFKYPTDQLLEVLAGFRPRIAEALRRPAPDAQDLLEDVLAPLEQMLGTFGEKEVDYFDFYRQGWRRAGLELPDGLLLEILDEEQRAWERTLVVVDGAMDTLARLKAKGLKLGLCSNASFPPEMMRRQVETNGIARFMDAIVFSSAVGWRKPSPAIYRAVLAELGVDAPRTLFVGDRLVEDYEGPIRFGMQAVICTAHATDLVPDGVRTIAALHEIERLL